MQNIIMVSFIFFLLRNKLYTRIGKYKLFIFVFIISLLTNVTIKVSTLSAQDILFDFDNAPLYTSLPIYQTAGGITAHLSATGQGYSIQNANVLGFTPAGFSGRILYPNSIYLSDVRIHFDHLLNDFSIMYACQELGCDDAATMRVTAFKNGVYIGTNTRTATFPGTWPSDTLRCTFPQGFDSVIIHYNNPPPTCQDYGVIYMADNMKVTPLNVNAISSGSELSGEFTLYQNSPNPFNPSTSIMYKVESIRHIKLGVYDVLGKEVATLVNEKQSPGIYEVKFNASKLSSGVYCYRLEAGNFVVTKKLLLIK